MFSVFRLRCNADNKPSDIDKEATILYLLLTIMFSFEFRSNVFAEANIDLPPYSY